MSSIQKLLIFIFLITSTLSSCSKTGLPTERNNGFKFYDTEIQKTFEENLKNSKVAFAKDNDGMILYSDDDKVTVEKIRNNILNSSFTPSIYYHDESLKNRFIQELRVKNIPFGIEMKNEREWISWPRSYDVEVKKIRDDL